MIRIFRKLRQTLLTENKYSKYLLYAIGEIILVVIGILIALQINNWNHEQLEHKKERLFLNELIIDLKEQASDVENYISSERHYYDIGQYLISHLSDPIVGTLSDTFYAKLNTLLIRTTFTPITTTFQELVSTGNLGIIRNKSWMLFSNHMSWKVP